LLPGDSFREINPFIDHYNILSKGEMDILISVDFILPVGHDSEKGRNVSNLQVSDLY
jgi:hypothetical protein